jgi:hemerythrin
METPKQTAIDFFYENIKSHFQHDGDLMESVLFTYSIAKLKEKEQIKEAHKAGIEFMASTKINDTQYSEKYFEQTFKK